MSAPAPKPLQLPASQHAHTPLQQRLSSPPHSTLSRGNLPYAPPAATRGRTLTAALASSHVSRAAPAAVDSFSSMKPAGSVHSPRHGSMARLQATHRSTAQHGMPQQSQPVSMGVRWCAVSAAMSEVSAGLGVGTEVRAGPV